MFKKIAIFLFLASVALGDLASLTTEIANHKDYKDLTDQQWIAKSALRGLTHRSQVDFDWWEDFYPKKIEEIRAELAGFITVPISAGMTKQEYDDQVAEKTAYLKAKEIRLVDKLAAVIEEQRLRDDKVVIRTGLHGSTPIYIDYDNGNDGNSGEAIGTSIKTITKYTTTQARTAGDVGYMRAGITWDQGTEAVDISFDEDGTEDAYISLIGCDAVTNDPWSDADNTLPIVDFQDGAYQMTLTADHYWKISRVDFRQSADTVGAVIVNGSHNCYILSCNFQDMGASATEGIFITGSQFCKVEDCDFLDCYGASIKVTGSRAYIKNCRVVAGVDVKSDIGLYLDTRASVQMQDCVFSGAFDVSDMTVDGVSNVYARNTTWSASGTSASETPIILSEDDDGTFESHISTFTNGTITRDTATVRGGGADSSAKMESDADCGINKTLLLGDQLRGFSRIWATKDIEINISIWATPLTAWDVALTSSTFYVEYSWLNNAATAARTVNTSTETMANTTPGAGWTEFTSAAFTPLQTGWVYIWAHLGAYDADEFVHVDIKPVVN